MTNKPLMRNVLPDRAGFASALFSTASSRQLRLLAPTLMLVVWLPAGCPPESGPPIFNNQDDKTNAGATYVGSAACSACHPGIADEARLHAHAHALKRPDGVAPGFPSENARAGVPNPPAGSAWTDIAYVIGGYVKAALFVDQAGFLRNDGVTPVQTQWNLGLPAAGIARGFAAYDAERTDQQPFDYDCFRCHATGAHDSTADRPVFQDGRPGMRGTFQQPGVQCEACHGPGSNHVPNPTARALFVPATAEDCGQCHARDAAGQDILTTADGFIACGQQSSELRASGGHSEFSCLFCHEPHRSLSVDRDAAIRNQCRVCHADQTMAGHRGKLLRRPGHAETLTCESCHMPFAVKAVAQGDPAVIGEARVGDTRSHIFRITTDDIDFRAALTPDGTRYKLDDSDRAVLTVDYVCLRCHNGNGLFELSVSRASEIALRVHDLPESD
ncbi:hypothetical protein RAS1_27820 [Phycisphaerae bacterium RAS1]|nr:hypothetical protein RAS1_27820 [Phycisphaerae bacterium RAS1]